MSLPGPSAPWRPALPLALPASPHAAAWPVAVPSQHRWLAEDLASASFLQTGDSDVVSSIFGRLSHAPTQRRAPSPQRDAMFDVNIVRGTLQAMLPLLPDRQPERGLAGGGRPQAPGRPGAPARPAGFDFDIMGMLNIIARALMMSSTLFKYATNPTYNMMFVNPNFLMPPMPMPPAPYREPRGPSDSYYHAFGDFGDYGYENQGNSGYGCGHGGCAPWWFSWTKNKGAYFPFVHRSGST